jgi:UTP-glucose-1-phosphate uridylyltransferase
MSRVKKAIILAAGKSTRYGSNKLIDPIMGKSTVQYCIEFCIENGIEDAYITISKSDFFFKNNSKLSHPIIESFIFTIFSFHIIDLFQSSKTLSEKLPIRFANIRV